MKTAAIATVLAFGVSATPMICFASTVVQNNMQNRQVLRRLSYRQAPVPAATPLARMDLTPRKDLKRPYDQITPEISRDSVPTSVSRRFSSNGPVGTVGLVNMSASHAMDSSILSNAFASQRSEPSQTVGAGLLYAFR